MDEKRKLRLLDKTEILDAVEKQVEEKVERKVLHNGSHPGQTNPIYKNLAKFINSKIGDKLSIRDLLK